MDMEKNEESLFRQFFAEHIEKLASERKARLSGKDVFAPVITVSIQPGSGGRLIGERLAKRFGFDFFNREIIQQVANSLQIGPEVIEKIEKERLSGVEDLIASFVRDRYLWPGMYMEHLESVMQAIGQTGHAVIVGRGANFMLPPEKRFSLRVVAPWDARLQNIMNAYEVSEEKAAKRIKNREERRRAFIRKSFHADVGDPLHYDMVINTGSVGIDEAVDAVSLFVERKYGIES